MSSPNIIPSELAPRLNKYRLQREFWDVIIKVEDRTFHCHRIILASASHYFQKMFSKKFKEADKKEIELKSINSDNLNADNFELLLTHIYGGLVSFDKNNVYRLLKIADYLCLQTLEDSCVKFLSENVDEISLNIAMKIFLFASDMQKTVLQEKFAGCIAKNFEHISQSEEFYLVRANDLLDVLRHPDFDENSVVVLEFLEKWVQIQSDEDLVLLPDLLDALNLNEIPVTQWLAKLLTARNGSSSPSISTSERAGGQFHEIICSNDDEERITAEEGDEFFSDRDKTSQLPFILFSRDFDENYSTYHPVVNLHQFKDHGKIWPFKMFMDVNNISRCIFCNEDNSSLSTQSYHGKIPQFCKSIFMNKLQYLISMHESRLDKSYHYRSYICLELRLTKELPVFWHHPIGKDIFKTLEVTQCGSNIYLYTNHELMKLDCQTHEWTELHPSGFDKTTYPNLVSYDNNLYLVGGKHLPFHGKLSFNGSTQREKTNGKLFQCLDPRTGKWSQMPSLAYARSKSASCIYDDKLYVSGGEDLAYFEGRIECFDFKAGKWSEFETSMPESKFNHIMRGYDDRLWFFGGKKYINNKIVEDITSYSYDLKEKKWSDNYSMPYHHNDFTVEKILDVVVNI